MITLPGPLDKLPSIRKLASLLFLLASALVLTRDSFPQNQRTIIMDNPRAPLLLTTPNLENPLHHHHHHHRARRTRRAARLRSAVVASGSSISTSSSAGSSPPPPPLRGGAAAAASTRRHMVALARAYRAARTRPRPVVGGGKGKKEERGEQEEYCFAVEEEGKEKKKEMERADESPFEKAMARMRELVGRGPSTADGLLPPRREDGRAGLENGRAGKGKVRGAGWHRRGYRDRGGFMWINVKEGTYGPVRGREASERETMRGFVRDVFDSHASATDSAGGYADLFFRKKSLVRMLVDLENRGLPDEEALVCDYFDGGETVYFKVYDKEGVECSPY
ncbi:hypothetical protein F4809DRAFT_637290 [Biscogniauxia mediterranea]|nr:hypothetical protein F4809DRAFT_637290 [Biscogniauxia mediterranea]